jgi:pimeloyl-ACP methyl ester carboxylesterase
VARLREVLARQDGPTIAVGHSYGGQIVTALGTDAPNVVGLVYIAAFGLDEGESIGALLAQAPRPRPWPTWKSTSRASPGCPKTTS